MDAIPAKLTAKYQATVPKKVREALHLEAGDDIVYEILDDQTVILRKVYPLDINYLEGINATLEEWEMKEDEEAYGDL
ncbi:MAG: type II toxin-antitoxin system PrlF family antitoxin [Waddliaceae bacterium]